MRKGRADRKAEAEWDRAEELTAQLMETGEICGHPAEGDVFAVIRVLVRIGWLK